MKIYLLIILSLFLLVGCEPQGEVTPIDGPITKTDNNNSIDSGNTNECQRSAPQISTNFLAIHTSAGASLAYSLTLKDNNTDCGNSNYSLSNNSLNAGLSLNLPSSITLDSGEVRVLSINLTTAENLAVGSYSFNTSVTDSSSGFNAILNQAVNIAATAPICVRNNPSITLSPNSFTGTVGETFNYTVSVTNNNTNCAGSSYNLSYPSLAAGFVSSVQFGLTVASGGTETGSINIQAGPNAGDFSFNLKAQDNANSNIIAQAALSFNLSDPAPTCIRANPTLSVTPASFDKYTGDTFSYTVKLKNNNQDCANTEFALSYINLPTGFTSNLVTSKTLADQAEAEFNVSVTAGSSAGNFTTQLKAVNNTYMATQNLAFNISVEDTSNPPSVGDNPVAILENLAINSTLSSSVVNGRGQLSDILYNPAINNFVTNSAYAEFGVGFNEDLGLVTEADPFYVAMEFSSLKNIDYISFGGAYPNQPQNSVMWKLQYKNNSNGWVTLEEGQGGWISNGILVWEQIEPIVAKAIRVIAYSDGIVPLKSIHLRGRGGAGDISNIKGTLVQYRGEIIDPEDTDGPEVGADGFVPYVIPPSSSTAVNIILDTDMALDVDDAGSLALLHALADNGEANILGIMHNTASPKAVGVIDAINTYYNRPDIPIGAYKGEFQKIRYGDYDSVSDNFPNNVKNNTRTPEAVRLYREILSQQPDQSVTIVSVGFLTNLELLLKSGADQYSPLTGVQLITQKVKLLSLMGGVFNPVKTWAEFNFGYGGIGPVTQYTIERWPTKIIFSGSRIGSAIMTGSLLNATGNTSNPVRAAYILFYGPDYLIRNSWDQTSVLLAVRGNEYNGDKYWDIISNGYATVNSNGVNNWVSGSHPNLDHHYLKQSMAPSDIADIIDELMAQPPQ